MSANRETAEAFEAHAAMMRTQAREKLLFANNYWRAAADGAFARFMVRFSGENGGNQ